MSSFGSISTFVGGLVTTSMVLWQLLWLAVIHFFFKESTGLPGILFTSNRHRICGNVKNVWFGTESSVKKKPRLVKVVIYFRWTSKGSRLFQSTKRISRICDSAWTLICMVVNFHGCKFCVWENYCVPLQQGFDRMTSCGFALIECQRLPMSWRFDQDESTVSWERGKLSWIMSTSLLCWRKEMLKAVRDFFFLYLVLKVWWHFSQLIFLEPGKSEHNIKVCSEGKAKGLICECKEKRTQSLQIWRVVNIQYL